MAEGDEVRCPRGRKEEVPRWERRGEVDGERETSEVARIEREEVRTAMKEREGERKQRRKSGQRVNELGHRLLRVSLSRERASRKKSSKGRFEKRLTLD